MTDLSPMMEKALVLAKEKGELYRQPGGYWTPPGEPMRGRDLGPEKEGRYVGTQTVRALSRRGLMELDGWKTVILTSRGDDS